MIYRVRVRVNSSNKHFSKQFWLSKWKNANQMHGYKSVFVLEFVATISLLKRRFCNIISYRCEILIVDPVQKNTTKVDVLTTWHSCYSTKSLVLEIYFTHYISPQTIGDISGLGKNVHPVRQKSNKLSLI